MKKQHFDIEETLTKKQREDITAALTRHGLTNHKIELECLFEYIEGSIHEISGLERDDFETPALGSMAKCKNEIRNLQHALNCLSLSSQETLRETVELTSDYDRFANKFDIREFGRWDLLRVIDKIKNGIQVTVELPTLWKFIRETLIEACTIALQDNPPKLARNNASAIFKYTSKGGRPKEAAYVEMFCIDLAKIFTDITGKEPTDTEGGAFDDFLSACLRIISPDRQINGTTNRKLIRASLPKYTKPKNVPKPTK